MKNILKDLGGIAAAMVACWAIMILLGMLMFAIWPPGTSYTAGISLEPQNVPGNLLGFILALYVFRSVTTPRSRAANDASAEKTDV
jgi:hypothetical protein